MATFKAYPNGITMGRGNAAPVGGKRSTVTGWSPAAVRRHIRWLYSIEVGGLTGSGAGVTLTMRDTPPTHEHWRNLVQRLLQRLRDRGMIRWHWVVEWQRRGTPHLHMAVYGPESMDAREVGMVVVLAWMDLAKEYGLDLKAQRVTPITDAVGWSKYLSKHSARGVRHYQRQGMPSGWSKTGRLWGYGGDWPSVEPVEGLLTDPQFWRFRRLMRGYVVAQARRAALDYAAAGRHSKAAAAWDSVAFLRRMLNCPDRALSTVRGVSDWGTGAALLDLATAAGWEGELKEVSEAPATV